MMEGHNEDYRVQWTFHQSNLVSVLKSLRESESLVDVTLVADGGILQAHRLVLSASSKYFQELFSRQLPGHPVVILKDVSITHLKVLLDFMYWGEMQVPSSDLSAVIKVSEFLQVYGLAGVGEKDKPSQQASTSGKSSGGEDFSENPSKRMKHSNLSSELGTSEITDQTDDEKRRSPAIKMALPKVDKPSFSPHSVIQENNTVSGTSTVKYEPRSYSGMSAGSVIEHFDHGLNPEPEFRDSPLIHHAPPKQLEPHTPPHQQLHTPPPRPHQQLHTPPPRGLRVLNPEQIMTKPNISLTQPRNEEALTPARTLGSSFVAPGILYPMDPQTQHEEENFSRPPSTGLLRSLLEESRMEHD